VSQYYELGDATLWNPSNGASRLFLCQVALFEEEIGLASGIGPMESDEAEVGFDSFEGFLSALLVWRGQTNHAVVQALSDGFIATCVVLAERAGATLCWPESDVGEWQERVRGQATRLAGFMAC
jgi:hypothetical protein